MAMTGRDARVGETTVFEKRRRRRRVVAFAALALSLAALCMSVLQVADLAYAQTVRPPESAATPAPDATDPAGGAVPGNALGNRSDAELWRDVRHGADFTVSIPDKKSAFLVQSAGDEWRAIRNGELPVWGLYVLAGMLVLLALFYLLRGRIRIDHGRAGATIERFNGLERFGHWLLAVSFVVLGISGLILLYGRRLMEWLQGQFDEPGLAVNERFGAETFATIALAGKWAHNNIAWAFMLGLLLVFLMWVRHNIPGWTDLKWMAKGGGLFVKGVHPDSRKFNAGQKIIFWATIIGGASLSLSGIALLFPFETTMMSKTFVILNTFGAGLQTDLTPMQEMQYQTLWHGIVAVVMIAIILAHIYIGTLGMEGAFAAMGSGQVDLNWAKEHHNLWVDEVRSGAADKVGSGAAATPAE